MHALYWGIWQFVLCVGEEWRGCSAFGPPATTLMLVCLTHLFIISPFWNDIHYANSLYVHTVLPIVVSWLMGSNWMNVFQIFLLFEAILFSIFTLVMFGTQISSIFSDETAIESLKSQRGMDQSHERGDGWKNLQQVREEKREIIMIMNIRYSVVHYQWNGWIHWRLLITLELVMSTVSSPYPPPLSLSFPLWWLWIPSLFHIRVSLFT